MAIPGLPPLPAGISLFTDAVLLIADSIAIAPSLEPQWGIFLNGFPVVVADNVTGFRFKKTRRLSKYPQEQGAFATYNKVALPFEPRIRFSTGGSISDKQTFIASIDAIIDDLNLYDVITPEVTYSSCNIIDYDYDRNHGNAGLLEIEVMLEQVVIAGASTFSNTASPTDASQSNNGLVQPQPYTGPNLGPLQPQSPAQQLASGTQPV